MNEKMHWVDEWRMYNKILFLKLPIIPHFIWCLKFFVLFFPHLFLFLFVCVRVLGYICAHSLALPYILDQEWGLLRVSISPVEGHSVSFRYDHCMFCWNHVDLELSKIFYFFSQGLYFPFLLELDGTKEQIKQSPASEHLIVSQRWMLRSLDISPNNGCMGALKLVCCYKLSSQPLTVSDLSKVLYEMLGNVIGNQLSLKFV